MKQLLSLLTILSMIPSHGFSSSSVSIGSGSTHQDLENQELESQNFLENPSGIDVWDEDDKEQEDLSQYVIPFLDRDSYQSISPSITQPAYSGLSLSDKELEELEEKLLPSDRHLIQAYKKLRQEEAQVLTYRDLVVKYIHHELKRSPFKNKYLVGAITGALIFTSLLTKKNKVISGVGTSIGLSIILWAGVLRDDNGVERVIKNLERMTPEQLEKHLKAINNTLGMIQGQKKIVAEELLNKAGIFSSNNENPEWENLSGEIYENFSLYTTLKRQIRQHPENPEDNRKIQKFHVTTLQTSIKDSCEDSRSVEFRRSSNYLEVQKICSLFLK